MLLKGLVSTAAVLLASTVVVGTGVVSREERGPASEPAASEGLLLLLLLSLSLTTTTTTTAPFRRCFARHPRILQREREMTIMCPIVRRPFIVATLLLFCCCCCCCSCCCLLSGWVGVSVCVSVLSVFFLGSGLTLALLPSRGMCVRACVRAAASASAGRLMGVLLLHGGGEKEEEERTGAIWLILPVVIRLSQRLSHACLSISDLYCETANGSLYQL